MVYSSSTIEKIDEVIFYLYKQLLSIQQNIPTNINVQDLGML